MKQEEKSLLSKGKIIDAAMKLFLEKGYENTTMQEYTITLRANRKLLLIYPIMKRSNLPAASKNW